MRTRVLFEVGVLLLVMVSAQGDQVGPEIGEVRTLRRDQLGVGDYVMGFERTWFAAARDAASTELLDLNPAGVLPGDCPRPGRGTVFVGSAAQALKESAGAHGARAWG
jgi:hypothetical protein